MTFDAGLPEIEPGPGRRKPPLGVWPILQQTVLLFVRHFWSLAPIAFIPAGVTTMLEYYLAPGQLMGTGEGLFDYTVSSSMPAFLTFKILSFVIGTLATGAIIAYVLGLMQDGSASILRSVAALLPVLIPLVVCDSAADFAVMVGLELLVVPGLFLATIWCVLPQSIIAERSAYSAFKRSWYLTSGYQWRCFGLMLVFVATFAIIAFLILEPFRYLIFSTDLANRLSYLSVNAVVYGLVEVLFAISFTLVFLRLKDIKEGNLPEVFA